MLDPDLECGAANSCPLSPDPLSSLVVGRGPGGPWGTLELFGQDARPGSGLCSWFCCAPSGTLTPPATRPSRDGLSWPAGPVTPASDFLDICSRVPPTREPRASTPTALPSCGPLGLLQPSLTSTFSEPPPPGSPPGSSAGSAPGSSCPQGGSRPSCPQAEAGSVGPTGESLGEHPCFPEPVPRHGSVVLAPVCGTPTHSLGASQQAIWVAGSQGCELRLPLTWLLPPSGPWGVSALPGGGPRSPIARKGAGTSAWALSLACWPSGYPCTWCQRTSLGGDRPRVPDRPWRGEEAPGLCPPNPVASCLAGHRALKAAGPGTSKALEAHCIELSVNEAEACGLHSPQLRLLWGGYQAQDGQEGSWPGPQGTASSPGWGIK